MLMKRNSHSQQQFSWWSRWRSLRDAIAGLRAAVRSEHNLWLHLLATLVVILAGAMTGLTRGEWCSIILAISLVWVIELVNTALELLADAVTLEFHPLIKQTKDIGAAAVLVGAIGALMIGLIVFIPHWW